MESKTGRSPFLGRFGDGSWYTNLGVPILCDNGTSSLLYYYKLQPISEWLSNGKVKMANGKWHNDTV